LKNLRPQTTWLFCIALVAALFSSASLAAKTIPFNATIQFEEQIGAATGTCFLTGAISGNGTATEIGPVSLASVDCINPISATSFLFVSDKVVLGVANGDQIWAAYAGSLSLTDGSIRGTYFVFGGTGRFKHARGFGTIQGSEAIDFRSGSGTGTITLTGTLVY